MDKRAFLKQSVLAIAGISTGVDTFAREWGDSKAQHIRIGVCTDLHQDIIHDAPERLAAFIDDMAQKRPDFIIQLGDFCRPIAENRVITNLWNSFPGHKYHVIGNHDMDGGFSRDEVVDFWEAKGRYYSFDQKGVHFVVLDTNENEANLLKNPAVKYGSFVSDRQLEWLESDLDNTTFPTIVFCHHGLDNDMTGVENATKVRFLLERVNKRSRFKKVQAVFSGHHHQDYVNVINDIQYIQINSMSYKWLGMQYQHTPYTDEINAKYPLLKHTVPYRDPLWAMLDISPDGILRLTGKRSEFVGASPNQLGVPEYENIYPVVPFISDRKIRLT